MVGAWGRVAWLFVGLLGLISPLVVAGDVKAVAGAPEGRARVGRVASLTVRVPLLTAGWGVLRRPEGRRLLVEQRRVVARREVPDEEISRRLDRYLAGRAGRVAVMVKELGSGRTYSYHAKERMITASVAKVQILMALLLRTSWKKLPAAVRRDADRMIRYSDNHAADRLWVRIGGVKGFDAAGRRFGLRRTRGVAGRCVDLYCWGITQTSVTDQVRLMTALVAKKSPLRRQDRAQVRRLMGAVVDGQNWGVSAAACRGERVALKNGWLRRVSNGRWATASVGLIEGDGRDFAVAVLSEGSPQVGDGIATVEGVAERVMKAFRSCPG